MNIKELQKKLDRIGVPKSMYQINGHLYADTLIFNEVHNTYWEYFYFDEKGRTIGYKRFNNEHDACISFFKELKSYGTVDD